MEKLKPVFVESTANFIGIIQKADELLICPVGNEGAITLTFLKCSELINRFGGVVVERLDGNNTNMKVESSLPVLPLEMLVHFRESAALIVAAPPQIVVAIHQTFCQQGFKNIFFLTPQVIAQVQDNVNRFINSGQMIIQTLNRIERKMDWLEYRVEQQNEICAVNTKAFARYEHCFRGKEVVIFGTGPTSKYYEPSIFPDAIHIGLNFAWRRKDIPFNYLFVIDANVNRSADHKITDGFPRIQDKIFIGRYPAEHVSHYLELGEDLVYSGGG